MYVCFLCECTQATDVHASSVKMPEIWTLPNLRPPLYKLYNFHFIQHVCCAFISYITAGTMNCSIYRGKLGSNLCSIGQLVLSQHTGPAFITSSKLLVSQAARWSHHQCIWLVCYVAPFVGDDGTTFPPVLAVHSCGRSLLLRDIIVSLLRW